MQEITTTILSELICSRLNHDIIGNIGAVSNAVELLEDGDMDFLEDIQSILKTSSKTLSSRLKFFRIAFGLNNTNINDITTIRKTIIDYLDTIGNKNSSINLNININNARFYKIAMLVSMIYADNIIRGGDIEIYEQDDKLYTKFSSTTPPILDKLQSIKSVMEGNCVDLQAKYAPLYYLRAYLEQERISISTTISNNVEFIFE